MDHRSRAATLGSVRAQGYARAHVPKHDRLLHVH